MAERYLEYLRSVKPKGPYCLMGFCLGGLMAYEVARRLTEAGEEVAFLGLFNSVPEENATSSQSFGKRVMSRFHKFAKLDVRNKMD